MHLPALLMTAALALVSQIRGAMIEPVFIGFSPIPIEVDEGDTFVDVHLRSDGGNTNPMEIRYQTENGTAFPSHDYDSFNGSARLQPRQTNHTIRVQIRADQFDEPDEIFYLKLTVADFPAYVKPDGARATILIRGRPSLLITRTWPREYSDIALFWRASATNYVLESAMQFEATWNEQTTEAGPLFDGKLRLILSGTNSFRAFRLREKIASRN
jgi:hypothetical protein